MSYEPERLVNAASVILLYSIKGTKTRIAMEVADFKRDDPSSEKYQKRIERKRDRLWEGD